jgi:hypothetical protein
MTVAPQPVAFTGALSLAADQSLPQDPIPYNFTGQYTQLQDSLLNLLGVGSESVPMGTIGAPGAIGLLISYPAGQTGAAPVLVTLNGGSQPLELAPGGMLVWFNPTPSAGLTACSIAYTTSCQLRVRVLG